MSHIITKWEAHLALSSWTTTLLLALFRAFLLLAWIWWMYSATITWNLGASLLEEETFSPAFFKALLTCFWAFWKWTEQRAGEVDLIIGFPHVMGPCTALYMYKQEEKLSIELQVQSLQIETMKAQTSKKHIIISKKAWFCMHLLQHINIIQIHSNPAKQSK